MQRLTRTRSRDTTVPVTIITTEFVYTYNSGSLVLSYAIGGFLSLLAICLGCHSTMTNKITHSNNFSALVATTRNPTLDTLFMGQGLGAVPLPKDLLRRRLGFGALIGDADLLSANGHTAFGVEDEIQPLTGKG
jgi:hypothetical protein